MPFEIVAIVLVAALAHASWNALVKSDDDRLATLGAVNAVRFLLCIPIVLVLPLPAGASWPFLAVSAILHVGYYTFLISAYRYGDLSKVYPLARGLSPLLVAAGAFAVAGERLGPIALAGVAVVCAGIASLSFGGVAGHARGGRNDGEPTDHGSVSGHDATPGCDGRDRVGRTPDVGGDAAPARGGREMHARAPAGAEGGGGTPAHGGGREQTEPMTRMGDGAATADDVTQARDDRRGIVFAAGTALFIAAYTVTDAMGARLSDNAVSYVAWLAILDGLPMLIAAAAVRRAALAHHLVARMWKSAAGGALQLAAYGLVVWALTLAPMAAVSALRETSVLFAVIIGVKLLGEPLGARRITAAALVAAGIMMTEWG